MNNESGWIAIHRKTRQNFLWKEKREKTKFEAWIDILLEVNHGCIDDILIGNEKISCGRGQSVNSLDTWAARWRWSKSRVRRFLKLLELEGMIQLENITKTTRLTVCNYDTYQTDRNGSETGVKQERNASETLPTPNNNDNNINNDNNDKNIPPIIPPGDDEPKKPKSKKFTDTELKKLRVEENTPDMIRIGAFKKFGRKASTLWNRYEEKSLAMVSPTKEEIDEMEKFYNASIPHEDYRRTTLQVLLNNWHGELDKARDYNAKNRSNTGIDYRDHRYGQDDELE